MSYESAQMLMNRIILLDEVTTQNRAENYIYGLKHMRRPKMTYNKSSLFNDLPFLSNFDYYGEFQ